MAYWFREDPHKFRFPNVQGIPGHVFGRHWHQRSGPKVNPSGHGDWNYDVQIRWVPEYERNDGRVLLGHVKGLPAVMAHQTHWVMDTTPLKYVENNLDFPIREHVKRLVSDKPWVPVILDWGCGAGYAVNDLTNEDGIKGKALIFGYGDLWYRCWNEIPGVKFLFFVKEHLPEYFRRTHLQADFIFSHGAMEYLHNQEFIDYLRSISGIMRQGAGLIFPTSQLYRKEFLAVADIFDLPKGCGEEESRGLCLLTRK